MTNSHVIDFWPPEKFPKKMNHTGCPNPENERQNHMSFLSIHSEIQKMNDKFTCDSFSWETFWVAKMNDRDFGNPENE